MSNLANHALVMAGGYFAIMNPIANAAIFTSLTAGMDDGADSIAVSPLGIPILAGPGTIAVSMSYSATSDLLQIGVNALVFLALCAVTYLCFRLGERVENRIGASGLRVTTQLMGLILTVIGVQMGIDGALGAVDLYLHPAVG